MAAAILAVLGVIAGCYFASEVVLPSVVALFMAMLVAPAAHWLMRRRVSRGWAAFAAVTAALAAVFLAGFACYRAAAGVAEQAPQYESRLREAASKVEARLSRFRRKTQTLVPQQGEAGRGGQGQAGGTAAGEAQGSGGVQWSSILLRGLGSLFAAAGLAVFVPFLALFLLLEEEPLSRALDRAAGPGYDAARLRRQAPRMARAYVFGNLLLALCLAVVQGGLFLALGLPNAVGLGVVTGLLNVVPILGVPAAIALPLLQGLGTLHGAAPFAAIAVTLLALHLAAANWIIPRRIGVHVKVNSTTATLSMLFFSWLWGLVGFLMAVPLAAIVKIALECSPRASALAQLLASHEGEARSRPAQKAILRR